MFHCQALSEPLRAANEHVGRSVLNLIPAGCSNRVYTAWLGQALLREMFWSSTPPWLGLTSTCLHGDLSNRGFLAVVKRTVSVHGYRWSIYACLQVFILFYFILPGEYHWDKKSLFQGKPSQQRQQHNNTWLQTEENRMRPPKNIYIYNHLKLRVSYVTLVI